MVWWSKMKKLIGMSKNNNMYVVQPWYHGAVAETSFLSWFGSGIRIRSWWGLCFYKQQRGCSSKEAPLFEVLKNDCFGVGATMDINTARLKSWLWCRPYAIIFEQKKVPFHSVYCAAGESKVPFVGVHFGVWMIGLILYLYMPGYYILHGTFGDCFVWRRRKIVVIII